MENLFKKDNLNVFLNIKNLAVSIKNNLFCLSPEEAEVCSLDSSVITDIIIDSILTYILGIKYYLPSFLNLLFYDEKNPYVIYRSYWFLRVLIPLIFLNESLSSENKNLNNEKHKKHIENPRIYRDFLISSSLIKSEILSPHWDYYLEALSAISWFIYRKISKFLESNREVFEKIKEKFDNSDSFKLLFPLLLNQNMIIKNSNEKVFISNNQSSFIPIINEGQNLCLFFYENIFNNSLISNRNKNIYEILKENNEDRTNLKSFSVIYYKFRCDKENIFDTFLDNSNLKNQNLSTRFFINFGPFGELLVKKRGFS